MPTKKSTARIPKATFGSVAVIVSNRATSVDWYIKKLGLDVIDQSTEQEGHWVTVGRKGQNGAVHLCQMTEFDPKFPAEAGPTGILFRLPGEFKKSCAALKSNGVRFHTPPRKETWGERAMIVDPDGNMIMLVPG
jgi:catechol 2,3-dioxygenase-like lactoylglutathione lyase family enzyme